MINIIYYTLPRISNILEIPDDILDKVFEFLDDEDSLIFISSIWNIDYVKSRNKYYMNNIMDRHFEIRFLESFLIDSSIYMSEYFFKSQLIDLLMTAIHIDCTIFVEYFLKISPKEILCQNVEKLKKLAKTSSIKKLLEI